MQLLSQAGEQQGEGALEALFSEHADRIYRVAYRVTGSPSDAEDVLQTIFLRLARRKENVDLGATAGSYLHRAAINAGLDLLRSRRRARAVPLETEEGGEQYEETAVDLHSVKRSINLGQHMVKGNKRRMHPGLN